MKWEVVQSRWCPADWIVEAIDYQNEGQVYVATFSGPLAQERAEEYAAWKTKQHPAEPVRTQPQRR